CAGAAPPATPPGTTAVCAKNKEGIKKTDRANRVHASIGVNLWGTLTWMVSQSFHVPTNRSTGCIDGWDLLVCERNCRIATRPAHRAWNGQVLAPKLGRIAPG